MHLKLIYNPTAGRGRARRHVREVEEYLRANGARVDCEPSTSADDLVRIAAESSRAGYDRVVVAGGDGTLNLAVREFDLEKGTLALIPTGSGDDFARVAGIPRDIRGACDTVLHGVVREFDVALANNLRYLGVAGLGFDSEVADFA
ncbi:MAG TPA: diacylglycerol kinase family protein, partial [Thermoanaerobaculia bacterium]